MTRTLRLRREVLALLTDEQLGAVAGGLPLATPRCTVIATLLDDCLSLNTCRSCQICTNNGAC